MATIEDSLAARSELLLLLLLHRLLCPFSASLRFLIAIKSVAGSHLQSPVNGASEQRLLLLLSGINQWWQTHRSSSLYALIEERAATRFSLAHATATNCDLKLDPH